MSSHGTIDRNSPYRQKLWGPLLPLHIAKLQGMPQIATLLYPAPRLWLNLLRSAGRLDGNLATVGTHAGFREIRCSGTLQHNYNDTPKSTEQHWLVDNLMYFVFKHNWLFWEIGTFCVNLSFKIVDCIYLYFFQWKVSVNKRRLGVTCITRRNTDKNGDFVSFTWDCGFLFRVLP